MGPLLDQGAPEVVPHLHRVGDLLEHAVGNVQQRVEAGDAKLLRQKPLGGRQSNAASRSTLNHGVTLLV